MTEPTPYIDYANLPNPTEGFLATLFITVRKVAKSRDFYSRVLGGTVVRVPKAYPAYFGAYAGMGKVRAYLDTFSNLFPVGRNGMHRYNNQDHSMLAAKAAEDCIMAGSTDKSGLWAINVEDEYHEARQT